MQLATALVINVLQLCVHIEIKPMGGEDAALLNMMQTGTLVLTTYLNFGALTLNYLTLAKALAQYLDPSGVGKYDAPFAAISVLMEILTFGLILSFGAVAAKNAFAKARELDVLGMIGTARARFGSSDGHDAPQIARGNAADRDAGESRLSVELTTPQASPAWKAHASADGRAYFHNELTGETRWNAPPASASAPSNSL